MDDGRILVLGSAVALSVVTAARSGSRGYRQEAKTRHHPSKGPKDPELAALDRRAAKDGRPVYYDGNKAVKPRFKIAWTPMSESWKAGFDGILARRLEAMSPVERSDTEQLVKILLSFGGDRVAVVGFDEDTVRLFERGQLWSGRGALKMPGSPSQCHANAAGLWEANQDTVILATGYALSKDGMWRQHSFGLNGGRAVETTEPRVAYFGFAMTPEESERFHEENG
jgi:hypothetical protein